MEWWFTLPWQIDGKVQGVLRHCFTSSNVGSTLIRAIFWAYLPETMTNKGLLTFHLSTFLAIHVVNISIKPSISRECGPPPIQLFKQRGAAQDWIKSHCLTSFRPLRTRQTPRKLRDKNIEKTIEEPHLSTFLVNSRPFFPSVCQAEIIPKSLSCKSWPTSRVQW